MRYAIIGNGAAGITAALTIRQRDRRSQITVIGGESDFFFSRTALMYAFMDSMTLRDLEPYERKSYDAKNIERIRASAIDLDAVSRTLALDDGRQLPYDRLLIATGSEANPLSIPGLKDATDGAVHFVSLQDLANCERLAPSTKRAAVIGGGLIGVELVECLVHHGIAVTFLVRENWYWPMALDEPEGLMIAEHIRRQGVDLRLDEQATAVSARADGRVSHIRTNKGEDLPCQMLGICAGVRPAIQWLANIKTPPQLGRGVIADSSFRTSLDHVFTAGDCAEFHLPGRDPFVEQIWYSAKRQGELAALAMLGDRVNYEPPIFYNSAKFFHLEYTTVGVSTRAPPNARSYYHRVPGREVTMRIIELDGQVIGFNMIGSRWNHTLFEQWIRERRSAAEAIADLHLAQFDVEFGGLNLALAKKDLRRQA